MRYSYDDKVGGGFPHTLLSCFFFLVSYVFVIGSNAKYNEENSKKTKTQNKGEKKDISAPLPSLHIVLLSAHCPQRERWSSSRKSQISSPRKHKNKCNVWNKMAPYVTQTKRQVPMPFHTCFLVVLSSFTSCIPFHLSTFHWSAWPKHEKNSVREASQLVVNERHLWHGVLCLFPKHNDNQTTSCTAILGDRSANT